VVQTAMAEHRRRKGIGMSFYRDHVLPRIINVACGMKTSEPYRARVCTGLAGEVVESASDPA
jgi:hypothetical protein